MPTDRVEFLGIRFDILSMDDVVDELADRTDKMPFSYVVTPNVDHVVRLSESADGWSSLALAYRDAGLCLCDSRILRLLARLRGLRLPVVTGSDLTARIFNRLIGPGERIAIIGGDAALLAVLRARYPTVELVQLVAPMGLVRNASARREAAKFIVESGARFTFIAVGSPQQEMIAAEAKAIAGSLGTALCIGAGLEFLAGRQRRAPVAAQRLSLEWAHRLLSDPMRLWRRYLLDGPRVFALAYRWPGQAKMHERR